MTSRRAPTDVALRVEHLTKSFGTAVVLRDLDLSIRAGEVHGLLGINGSGKSTLIRILAGYHTPDAGVVSVGTSTHTFPQAAGSYQARSLGLAFVHQDLGLLPELSVCENFFLGELARRSPARAVPWAQLHRRVTDLLAGYGIGVDSHAPIASTSSVDRARIAILRAYTSMEDRADHGGVLVLDEPTVFLSARDREVLFGLMRELTGRGGSVLLVSHDLADIRAAADRVTVLRDGRGVGTLDVATSDDADLVARLLGTAGSSSDQRSVATARDRRAARTDGTARPALIVDSLVGGAVRHASFTVGSGEIVGVTGVPGSGFDDVPYLVYGGTVADAGTARLAGAVLDLRRTDPVAARRHGFALVPGDRAAQAGLAEISAAENVAVPVLGRLRGRGRVLSSRSIRDRFTCGVPEYKIHPAAPDQRFGDFSGGNQQKIVLLKWLQTAPEVLLLHEPTQGVDVTARFDLIHALMRAAEAGSRIVWASTDQDELATVCDRVLVFRDGFVAADIPQPLTSSLILETCYGQPTPHPSH